MDTNPMRTLLQVHLATDSSAVLHLPFSLRVLDKDCFASSSHLPKWTARVNALLHSKDRGARWAGLCLAWKTCRLSKGLTLECGQGWLAIAIPLLSKPESDPVKAWAIALCKTIFSQSADSLEFQRQVVTPNLPKFVSALVSILQASCSQQLMCSVFHAFLLLAPLYPSSHRASQAAITSSVLRVIRDAPESFDVTVVEDAAKLYSHLHVAGGKVGAAKVWRQNLDAMIDYAQATFKSLRTTFPETHTQREARTIRTQDPAISIPADLHRLRRSLTTIQDLLQSPTTRPVDIPVGQLAIFSLALVECSSDKQIEGHVDPTIRSMEVSIVPELRRAGCELLTQLAKSLRLHLTPYLGRALTRLVIRLDQDSTDSKRYSLRSIQALLTSCHPLQDIMIVDRLMKSTVSLLTNILPSQHTTAESSVANQQSNRRGKKRARGYEGDEIFQNSSKKSSASDAEAEVGLLACDIMSLLFRLSSASPSVHSICAKVFVSLLLCLPQIPPNSVTADTAFHARLVDKVRQVCAELGAGSGSVMNQTLGLVINISAPSTEADFDLLLHPRVPPVIRTWSQLGSITLCQADESLEEAAIRVSMGLTLPIAQEAEVTPRQDAPSADIPPLYGQSQRRVPDAADTIMHEPSPPPFPKPQPELIQPEVKQPPLPPPEVEQAPLSRATPPMQGSSAPEPVVFAAPVSSVPKPSIQPQPEPVLVDINAGGNESDDNVEMPSIDVDSDSDESTM